MKNNKNRKKFFGIAGLLGFLTLILTSCNSFCSALDSATYRYAYDPINTQFFDTQNNAEKFVYNALTDNGKKEVYYKKDKNSLLTLENVASAITTTVFDETTKELKEETVITKNEGFFESAPLKTSDELYYVRSSNITTYSYSTDKDGKDIWTSSSTTFSKNSFVLSTDTSARSNNVSLPTDEFWNELDKKSISYFFEKAKDYITSVEYNSTYELFYGYSSEEYNDYKNEPTKDKENILLNGGEYDINGKTTHVLGRNNSLFVKFGKYKYISTDTESKVEMSDGDYWSNINSWNNEISESKNLGDGYNMGSDYFSLYKSAMNTKVSTLKSCFTIDDGFYGHLNDDPLHDTVQFTNKTKWSDAWSHGWIEGLLVYPVAYMTEYFSHTFGMNGWGQISAVLLVTVIVRGLFMLISFKSTLSQQKMQYLQPEIAKLQEKYPNSNTNQYEKQRLAQAQMNLYKRYKIHPFGSILIMIVQFPVFIAVWNGLSAAASLSRDAVLGLRLSDTISSVLFNLSNWPGLQCWTALILIVLMSATQILSMQLPQWLSKKRMKNVTKMYKNPAANSSQKQMKIVSWVMTIFIIIMGFTLPAAMGVYWFAGALFSMIQTVIMHFILQKKGDLSKKGDK